MIASQKAGSIRAAMRSILRGATSSSIAAVARDDEDKKDNGADEATEDAAPADDKKPSEKMADPATADPESGSEGEDDVKQKPKEATAVDGASAAEATAVANERWATVLRSPQAAGRTDAAIDLLAESTMGADKITALLGKLPAAASSTFADRMMAEAPNPDIKPDGGKTPDRNVATRMAERHAPKKGN
jgi:hypothetical protein